MSIDADENLLRRAAETHRQLRRRATATAPDEFNAVLHLGSAISMHSLFEDARLYGLQALLDPAVQDELRAEHRRIDGDLSFMEELLASQPDSPDLLPLSTALLDRMVCHLDREQRVLYGPLDRLNSSRPSV